jgi:hypothetical protein
VVTVSERTLLYIIAILLSVIVGIFIWDRAQGWRADHRKAKPADRTAECETCGAIVSGKDWWSLITIPPAVEGEPTFGGGTVMVADYCAKHRPTTRRGPIAWALRRPRKTLEGSTLQRHG